MVKVGFIIVICVIVVYVNLECMRKFFMVFICLWRRLVLVKECYKVLYLLFVVDSCCCYGVVVEFLIFLIELWGIYLI